MISKGEELIAIIAKDLKVPSYDNIVIKILSMSDVKFDGYLSRVLTNRARDPNVGKFRLPELNRLELWYLFELILDNNSCGVHNSYWSRIIWMIKGGPLVKAFPPNSKMIEFEKNNDNY